MLIQYRNNYSGQRNANCQLPILNNVIMKKTYFFLIAVISLLTEGFAQLHEVYPTSNRYLFNEYEYNCTVSEGLSWWSDAGVINVLMPQYLVPEGERGVMVYGVALPIHVVSNNCAGYDECIYQLLQGYEDTSVFVSVFTKDTDGIIRQKAQTRMGTKSSLLMGNYFQMPGGNDYLYHCPDTIWPTLEYYFDAPVFVTDTFYVGVEHSPFAHLFNYGDPPEQVKFTYLYLYSTPYPAHFAQGNTHDHETIDYFYYVSTSLWGGAFPIIAPVSQCAAPFKLEVCNPYCHRASVCWYKQYGNDSYELEWGPAGFADGTGTLVTGITADSNNRCQVDLDSLQNATTYTVRVRAQCNVTGGYSDWTEMDFTPESWYTVSADVNDEARGHVNGTGQYREGSVAQLFAWPHSAHFPFLMWDDSVQSNPRNITVTEDIHLTAIFGCDTCGNGNGNNDDDDTTTQWIVTPERGDVHVYPNPAHSMLTVKAAEPIGQISIHDMRGREATLRTSRRSDQAVTLNVKGFTPGVYILSVQLPSATVYRKLIIK